MILLIRIGPRDQWVPTALIFYTTPWPVLGISSCAAYFLCRNRIWLILASGFLLTGVILLRGPGPIAGEGDVHLKLWNAQNPVENQATILREMLTDQPDVVVTTDSGPLAYWLNKHGFPDQTSYSSVYPGGGFLFLLKSGTTLEDVRLIRLDQPHSRLAVGTLTLRNGKTATLMAVELDYDPRRSKQPLFQELGAILDTRPPGPMILAGDFNVPPGSRWLGEIRKRSFFSAFEQEGEGFEVSWPMPIPLLGIDQVWGDSQVLFHRATYSPALHSDHRSMNVVISILEENGIRD